MTLGQQVEIGPLHFSVIRILIVIGLLRVMAKGERIAGGMTALDWAAILWGTWAIFSALFHEPGTVILRSGVVYTELGVYFLMRVFIREPEDVRVLCRILCIVLIPLAFAMLMEKLTARNYFAVLGGVSPEVAVREGRLRASGPFRHAILAGTVGAVCLPMALLLWRDYRRLAVAGALAAILIVYASGASGPVMTAVFVLAGMAAWRIRQHVPKLIWAALLLVIALAFVMNDPVYYLLARIDITGGSTGWHRAALIESAIKHLSEWWLVGTDQTRHWMPTGVYSSDKHTDITNHFIQMGVFGGLPLMFLFSVLLFRAFVSLREVFQRLKPENRRDQFTVWTLGAVLFGHATAFMGISYFDQTVVFLYLVLAAIGSLHAMRIRAGIPKAEKLAEKVKRPELAAQGAPLHWFPRVS